MGDEKQLFLGGERNASADDEDIIGVSVIVVGNQDHHIAGVLVVLHVYDLVNAAAVHLRGAVHDDDNGVVVVGQGIV